MRSPRPSVPVKMPLSHPPPLASADKRPLEPPQSPDAEDIPPKFDPSSASIGPTLLPDAKTFDPLKSIQWDDYFWNYVDNYFQPVNKKDVAEFRNLPTSNLLGGRHDDALLLPSVGVRADISTAPQRFENAPPVDDPAQHARLNSYSLTQRLVACLMDTGTAPAPSPCSNGVGGASTTSAAIAGAVAAGSSALRGRQFDILEQRVALELTELSVLPAGEIDKLATEMRKEQWKLREQKAANTARQRAVARAAVSELRHQADRREERRHDDHVQMAYINRMLIRLKKNKKSRAKLQKFLSKNFGHYKDDDDNVGSTSAVAAGSSSAHASNTANGSHHKSKSKSGGGVRKKKRKSEANSLAPPLKKHAPAKTSSGVAHTSSAGTTDHHLP